MIVPRLPGSEIASSTTRNVDSRRSSIATTRWRPTATIGRARDGGRHPLEHSVGDDGERHVIDVDRRTLAHVDVLEGPPCVDSLADEHWSLDQEDLVFLTSAAVVGESPQTLDLRMVRAEWGQEACCFADSLGVAFAALDPPGLCGLDEGGERRRIGHGEVGEDLAVDLDLGGLQAGDEPAVADAVAGGRRR